MAAWASSNARSALRPDSTAACSPVPLGIGVGCRLGVADSGLPPPQRHGADHGRGDQGDDEQGIEHCREGDGDAPRAGRRRCRLWRGGRRQRPGMGPQRCGQQQDNRVCDEARGQQQPQRVAQPRGECGTGRGPPPPDEQRDEQYGENRLQDCSNGDAISPGGASVTVQPDVAPQDGRGQGGQQGDQQDPDRSGLRRRLGPGARGRRLNAAGSRPLIRSAPRSSLAPISRPLAARVVRRCQQNSARARGAAVGARAQ